MTDTTDKALDALQERLLDCSSKYYMQDVGIAALDARGKISRLRRERDAAIAREKALLASNQEERTALVEAASLRRERDALRALIDTPSAPSPEAVARAALKNGAKALHEFAGAALTALAEEHALQMAEKLEEMASDDPTIAAIITKAGGGE
jgi:hypothetical protein